MDDLTKLRAGMLLCRWADARELLHGLKSRRLSSPTLIHECMDKMRAIEDELDSRTRPVHPAGDVGEALARWKLHKATDMKYTPLSNPYAIVAFHELCGFRWDLAMMDEDKELLADSFAAQFEGESA